MFMKKNTYGRFLVLFAVVPVILVGTLLTIMFTNHMDKYMEEHAEEMLASTSNGLSYTYELLAGGVGGFTTDEQGNTYIGEFKISGDYSIVDNLKRCSGAELTVFHKDTRVVTTIKYSNGDRIVNSKASKIWENYISKGQYYFSNNMNIMGVKYYAYYSPIVIDGEIIGMSFAGKPCEDVYSEIGDLNNKLIKICIVLIVITVLLSALVTIKINTTQKKIIKYLNEIDEGHYNHELDARICKRSDEFGNIGRKLVKLNSSLDSLIRKDALTNLYNRRAALDLISSFIAEANKVDGESFCLAIGDIDFFKKVNDTYGHNCGDEVLKRVAKHIDCQAEDEGFAARWGGEEFVIAFKGNIDASLKKLNVIADNVRQDVIEYGGESVKITMTFGIVEYRPPRSIDELISTADVLLYKGKDSGRNKIVS